MAFEENTRSLPPKQKELVSILLKPPHKRTQMELEFLIPLIQKI